VEGCARCEGARAQDSAIYRAGARTEGVRVMINPSIISPQRITRFIQSRFNPIRSLTPEWLAQMIDSFDAGYLREFALMADAIERRDDVLMSVAPKRKKAIGRHGYEIVTMEKSAQAEAHAKTLKHFYDHITAINAIRENERGGFKLLSKQMADSIGKHYAVHEIVWKPAVDGLTAEFRFVPLWFFENRTGRLRYLPQEGAAEGIELDPNNWLVTVGDGLMLPCAIAYMFKHLPLKDWLVYCERFGMPIPIGTTSAPKDSAEWLAMLAFVEDIMAGAAAVKNQGEDVTILETKSGGGELPHPPLIERMDRAMSAMWRGSDLSTMSRGGAGQERSTGASVQGEESAILELDDTQMISETLNIQVSRRVIMIEHGDDVPLAYLKVLTERKQDVQSDILVDQFLLQSGFPITIQSVAERYGREVPDPKPRPEDLLKPVAVQDVNNPASRQTGVDNVTREISQAIANGDVVALANALKKKAEGELVSKASEQLGKARKMDLAPVAARIGSILSLPEDAQGEALRVLPHYLPSLLRQANREPKSAKPIADTLSAGFFNGVHDAALEREAA
jgi:phage gp29-like protein